MKFHFDPLCFEEVIWNRSSQAFLVLSGEVSKLGTHAALQRSGGQARGARWRSGQVGRSKRRAAQLAVQLAAFFFHFYI
jgi:hypothetical protein